MLITTFKKKKLYLAGVALLCFPLMASAQGLGALLHQVEQKAPVLQAAQAKANAAAAAIRMARSQYWGHGEVFGQTTHYNADRLVNPISFPSVLSRSLFDKNTYGIGASYTLPVDIDGRIAAKVHEQQHLSRAALQGAAQTRLSLFAQTVVLYRGLQRLEGIKKAHIAHLKALRKHQKVTAISVKVGRVAAVELLRIEAEIQSVKGLLAGVNGSEVRLRAALAALLNQTDFSDPLVTLSNPPAHVFSDATDDSALQDRPDLQAEQSIIHAENENLKGTKHEWFPSLALHAESFRNQGYTANGANTWSISVQLHWQFWDGGRRTASADRVQANREAARQQYHNTLNQARADLQSAMADWQAASQQYQAASSGLHAARETERIQSDRFASGRISAVDLIDAEAALARAKADQTTALANWWLADDQLYLVQGKTPSAYAQTGE